MATADPAQSLAAASMSISRAATHILSLAQQGWTVTDDLSSVRLLPEMGIEGVDLVGVLKPLQSLTLAMDMTTDAGYRVGVVNQHLSIIDAPQAPGDYFEGEALLAAQRAAEGDVDAALQLPQEWTGTIDVDLAMPLNAAQPHVFWRVIRTSAVLVDALRRKAWWDVGDLVRDPDGDHCRPVAYLVLDNESSIKFEATSFAVSSIGAVVVPERRPTAANGIARPEELSPISEPIAAAPVVEVLASYAAATAWATLASSWTPIGQVGRLEFFGFRRVYGDLPSSGMADSGVQAEVAALYKWATSDASPDRLLAIRQVCSLYQEGEFLVRAADVLRAAEPIYAGLRTDAVAEVFATHRDARSLALTVARESADAALTAAKSVAERTLAATAAIGGVALARVSSTPVKQDLATRLMLGIALFAGFLALWSIIIEGPAMAAPLRTLDGDIRQVGDILTADQRQAVTGLSLVKAANRRVLLTRIAAPLVYVGVGIVALMAR